MIQMNIEPGNKYDPVCETTGEHSIVSPYSKSFRESNPQVRVQEMANSRTFKGPKDRQTTRASRRDRRRVKELKIINDYFCIILNRVNLY